MAVNKTGQRLQDNRSSEWDYKIPKDDIKWNMITKCYSNTIYITNDHYCIQYHTLLHVRWKNNQQILQNYQNVLNIHYTGPQIIARNKMSMRSSITFTMFLLDYLFNFQKNIVWLFLCINSMAKTDLYFSVNWFYYWWYKFESLAIVTWTGKRRVN